MSLAKPCYSVCLLHLSACVAICNIHYSSPGKILAVSKENASHSCYFSLFILYILSSPFILCLLIMRRLYSHIKKRKKKKKPGHIQKCIFSIFPSLSLSHVHTNTCACLHTYIHRTQTVSCALPTASSTKREHTACPCLTHIYTHICTHKLCNCPLHTLKGTWHRLIHRYRVLAPYLDIK